MYLPSIRQLQYLIAVVELRHFGQAAERCFVTQSTLSSAIQELETLLGAQLLERTKRKVMPTDLGLEMAERARQVLQLSAEMVELAQQEKAPLSGKLKLGVIPTIGPFLLPQVLPSIRKSYPRLELYLIEDQTARLIERLNSGEIDAAILALPFELGQLQSATFWKESFWVALPKGHPLSEGGAIGSVKLPSDELLMLEEGHCMRDHALSACHLSNLQHSATFQGTSLYTLIEMVAGGQGITFLPAMAVDSGMAKRRNISLRPLAEKGPHREIGLAWRATYHRKHDLQLLMEYMTEVLEKKASKK